jgi:hypothetical protein
MEAFTERSGPTTRWSRPGQPTISAGEILDPKERIDLAISETQRSKDIVFVSVGDVVPNYVISPDDKDIEATDAHDYLPRYTLDLSEKVVKLATQWVLQVWAGHAYRERSRIEK